ncbi:MAG: M3 family metallopeptidase [Patescibacteria group bacterium]
MNVLPLRPEQLSWVTWTESEMKLALAERVEFWRVAREKIKKRPPAERTFANTVWVYELAGSGLASLVGQLEILMNFGSDEVIRANASRVLNLAQKQILAGQYDLGLYRVIKDYAGGLKEKLPVDARRLLKRMLVDFRRLGLDLSAARRRELQKNSQKIAQLSLAFSKNINDYQDDMFVTAEELDGLPSSYVGGLRHTSDGRHVISLQYPDAFPFMRYAKSDARRAELALKLLRRGGQKNMKLLQEALALRARNAKLLGYGSHDRYALELKMAKTPARALSLVRGLLRRAAPAARRQLNELESLKRRLTDDRQAKLRYHDIGYYGELARQEKFVLDPEQIRSHFELNSVLEKMLTTFASLLSLRFKKLPGSKLWHSEVDLYEVADAGGDLIGYFAFDLYPRPGKYHHMAVFSVWPSEMVSPDGQDYRPGFYVLGGNFPRPTSDQPALLSHGEVETLFHEFGHVLHFVLGHPRFATQGAFSTALDFVEVPSQTVEQWVWQPAMLTQLGQHYKTKASLPLPVIESLVSSRRHLAGYGLTRQLVASWFDLILHHGSLPTDPNQLYAKMFKKYIGLDLPAGAMFAAGWGHILGGYDSGYYSYIWSQVYAADVFGRFVKEGLFNQAIGRDYRCLLEVGASVDEMKTLVTFLGRRPSRAAYLKQIDL